MSLLSKRRPSSRREFAPPGVRLLLHVGCGTPGESDLPAQFGSDWQEVRLDVDPSVRPDIVASITDLSPVPDESVDAVFSHHNIEHVYPHEVVLVMDEFFRVLKPGGEVVLGTPDLQNVARAVASGRLEDRLYASEAGDITALDVLYGFADDIAFGREYMAHRTGFTRGTLTRKLGAAGFEDIEVRRQMPYALWATARKPVA